jgi:hypothetical protein
MGRRVSSMARDFPQFEPARNSRGRSRGEVRRWRSRQGGSRRYIKGYGTPSRAVRLPLPRPRTGKSVRARYRADRDEIAARYAQWEIIGPAEIRDVESDARYFTPHTSPLDAALRPYNERPPELAPTIDAAVSFLLAVFLRRYVTYCARLGEYAAMNAAARLFADIKAAAT